VQEGAWILQTNFSIHVLLLSIGEVIGLGQELLAFLGLVTRLSRLVKDDCGRSKFLEEFCPAFGHMRLVRFSTVFVPLLQLCWCRSQAKEVKAKMDTFCFSQRGSDSAVGALTYHRA
jgi:hypothetical protein